MKAFIVLISALLIINSAAAQDLLVKRNGEQMRVKILKVSKKKIQFVRFGTELPVYNLPISDIEYIEYPMGDRDVFNKPAENSNTANKTTPTPSSKPQTESLQKWHGAVPAPSLQAPEKPIAESSNEPTYTIGDIYDKNGIKGVVALISDGGKHGLIMSLDEACLAWSTIPRKQAKPTGAIDRRSGEANMIIIERFIKENNLSWSDFPAFEWCRNKGEGWFLPSLNELWSAGTMYMGGSRTASKRKMRKFYNQNIETAGGTPISDIMIYHSSTEEDAKYSYYSHMNSEPPYTNSGYKADKLFVRAFHRF